MMILAIDPGPEQSAWLLYDPGGQRVRRCGISKNEDLLRDLQDHSIPATHLAIESMTSYGLPVGHDVFETCYWIGKFELAFGGPYTRIPRREVKLYLCNDLRAKDASIRQALIDRFGPGRAKAVGRKASPGPLYGIAKDLWAALGVAVTYADRAA
jgi:hypothetical protein